MSRLRLGPIVLLALVGAPLLIAPAVGWRAPAEDTAASGEPQVFAHDDASFLYLQDSDQAAGDRPALQRMRFDESEEILSDREAVSSPLIYRMLVTDSASIAADTSLDLYFAHAEPGVATDPAVELPLLAAADDGGATPPETERVPLSAALDSLVMLEAQKTLIAIGISAHTSISLIVFATPISQTTLGHMGDADVETALPGWLLQATWILVLVAIGLGVRAYFSPLALALFSRFTQSDVLHNERRGRIFAAIQADPGLGFGELAARTGLAAGVVQHHLRLLEQHGLVRRARDGRTTRLYPRGPKFEPPALRSDVRRRVVDLLREGEGLSAQQLAGVLGQRTQSTWHHLQLLAKAGLVDATRDGRSFRWRAKTA